MIIIFFVASLLLASTPVLAETLRVDLLAGEIEYSNTANTNAVNFFEGSRWLGRYDNLIVRESSISSNVVKMADGGVAIAIDSEGSRNKYNILTPIINEKGRLHTDCSYKTIYDAVDERRSVGAACRRTELAKFDVSSVINDGGMIDYKNQVWINEVSPITCPKAVGLEVDGYRIARCDEGGVSEEKKQKVIVFDGNGKKLLSIRGFEFIPALGRKFHLISVVDDQYFEFSGDLECLAHGESFAGEFTGVARIAGRFSIKYIAHKYAGCYSGRYSYLEGAGDIAINGYRRGDMIYLIEMNDDKNSSGLFVLNRFDDEANGVWVKIPPKSVFSVN